jgi:type IV pilus assembly protein PilO
MAKESSLSRLPGIAKFGIGVSVLGLAAIAYWVVFYGDLANKITAAEAQEQTLRKDLGAARKAEFAYQKDLEELAQRKQRQSELNKVLPKETEYPAFLSSVQSVANVTGVSLSAWSPQSEVKEQYYARIPMKLELDGRFHQIAKFFYGVGQVDRIINMENISLINPTQKDEEIYVSVTALATAFRSLDSQKAQTKRDKRAGAQK